MRMQHSTLHIFKEYSRLSWYHDLPFQRDHTHKTAADCFLPHHQSAVIVLSLSLSNRPPPSCSLSQQQTAAVICSLSTTGLRRRFLFPANPVVCTVHANLTHSFGILFDSIQSIHRHCYQHVFYSCNVILRQIRLSSDPCRHQHQKQHSLCAGDGEGSLHHVG